MPLERWQSGRSRYLGKVVYGQPYPGFESLSLRHLNFLFFCSKYVHKGKQLTDFNEHLLNFVQMLRNIEDEFKLHSLTPNEQAVFYTILKSNDVCNISKIVDESGLSRSTVYKILRKLEDNNLIEALQSESDKRESIVSLKVLFESCQ